MKTMKRNYITINCHSMDGVSTEEAEKFLVELFKKMGILGEEEDEEEREADKVIDHLAHRLEIDDPSALEDLLSWIDNVSELSTFLILAKEYALMHNSGTPKADEYYTFNILNGCIIRIKDVKESVLKQIPYFKTVEEAKKCKEVLYPWWESVYGE